ncbi:MAG: CaiB/BaiF CoA-transferase family protein [Burkholderiaceae bacterium]
MSGLSDSLAGCRIVEFGLNLPGPLLTQRLGRYGAYTVKVEPPTGDPTAGMFKDSAGVAVLYQMLNGQKKIERIDLKTQAGKEQALHEVAGADIVVESSTPGTMIALGLGYDHCRKINPSLIYCSLTGFGDQAVPGHDINFVAAAGLGSAMGYGHRARLPLFPVADIAGGVLAAESAILAGLLKRHATGDGQEIQINIAAQLRQLNVIGAASRAALVNRGDMFLRGDYPCYRVYRCKDDTLLAVGALEPKFWIRFCQLTGLESLGPRQFETFSEGDAHMLVENVMASRYATDWEAASLVAPCCLTAVL